MSRYEDKQKENKAAEQVRTPDHSSRYADKNAPEKPVRKKSERIKAVPIAGYKKKILIAAGAAAVIVYAGTGFYYGSHFYPGTSVYGIEAGNRTAEEVQQDVEEQIGAYTLSLQERSGEAEQISAAEIGLSYVNDGGIARAIKDQKSALWLFMLLGQRSAPRIGTTYEESMVDQVLAEMKAFDPEAMVEPQDAYIGDTESGYEVVPEVQGSMLDYTAARKAVMDALDTGATEISLEGEGCYIQPKVKGNDLALNAEVDEKNALLGANITYDFGDETEVVDASVIKTFIAEDERGEYFIDEGAVWDYVEAMAEKYNTYGGDREFSSIIGTTEYLSGGDYGWEIDQNETAQNLLNAIKEKRTETVDPIYLHTGWTKGRNDIGDTFIEICIARQKMWVHVDGEIVVETPVVTGNPSKGNETPSGGVWAIDYKQENAVLVGATYRQPVKYWIAFNGGVGIHDLQSRAYFGGTIYLTNGSHGCINTPLEAVKQVYEIAQPGMPVIVYDGTAE